MKTCPVCKAVAFDDAEVCYGCLHRFTLEEPLVHGAHCKGAVSFCSQKTEELLPLESDAVPNRESTWLLGEPTVIPNNSPFASAPSFKINMIPMRDNKGITQWSCNVEMVAP